MDTNNNAQQINVQVIDEARARELVGGLFLHANIPGRGRQTLLIDAGERENVTLSEVLAALTGDQLAEGNVAVAYNGRVTDRPQDINVQAGDEFAATPRRSNG